MVEDIETTTEATGFDTDPIREQWSHTLGNVFLFPPAAESSMWGQLPWRLVTEFSWDSREEGQEFIVHPDHLSHCWNHLALIGPQHLWPSMPAR